MPESEFAFEDRILQPGDLWKWSIDDSVRSCRCQVSSHFSIRKEIPADDDIGTTWPTTTGFAGVIPLKVQCMFSVKIILR
jgi:hypothetical protein